MTNKIKLQKKERDRKNKQERREVTKGGQNGSYNGVRAQEIPSSVNGALFSSWKHLKK